MGAQLNTQQKNNNNNNNNMDCHDNIIHFNKNHPWIVQQPTLNNITNNSNNLNIDQKTDYYGYKKEWIWIENASHLFTEKGKTNHI